MGVFACNWPDHKELFRFRCEAEAHITRIHYRNGRLNAAKLAEMEAKRQSTRPVTSTAEAYAEVMAHVYSFLEPPPSPPGRENRGGGFGGAFGGGGGDPGGNSLLQQQQQQQEVAPPPICTYRSQAEFEAACRHFPPPISQEEATRMVLSTPKLGRGANGAGGAFMFACRWPACRKKCRFSWNLRTHVRTKHLKLPKTKVLMQAVGLDVEAIDEFESKYIHVYTEEEDEQDEDEGQGQGKEVDGGGPGPAPMQWTAEVTSH